MNQKSKITLTALSLVVIVALFFLLQPPPTLVEASVVARQPFLLTIQDQGRTRAYNPFLVAAPITGRLLRVDLDEGDKVSKNQVIARVALQPQDQRTLAVEQANLVAAEARLRAEQANLEEAQGTLSRARRELERRNELAKNRLTSVEEVEDYQQTVYSAEARVQSLVAAVEASRAEVDSVRSRLLGSASSQELGESSIEEILAPTDGTILRVLEENQRVVAAGTPLFEISNEDSIEVVVDMLTQGAVSVSPGDSAHITGWGGDYTINGRVRYIEPEAFTKVSALGVEEQRVNVIVDLLDAPDNLGSEYRVEVAVVVWESDDELVIPSSALFQRNGAWNVFVVEQQEVKLQAIEIGHRNRDSAQVVSGLDVGDTVIQYPSDLIEEGIKVRVE